MRVPTNRKRLTAAEWERLFRAKEDDGVSVRFLAERFGISRSRIGKEWRARMAAVRGMNQSFEAKPG